MNWASSANAAPPMLFATWLGGLLVLCLPHGTVSAIRLLYQAAVVWMLIWLTRWYAGRAITWPVDLTLLALDGVAMSGIVYLIRHEASTLPSLARDPSPHTPHCPRTVLLRGQRRRAHAIGGVVGATLLGGVVVALAIALLLTTTHGTIATVAVDGGVEPIGALAAADTRTGHVVVLFQDMFYAESSRSGGEVYEGTLSILDSGAGTVLRRKALPFLPASIAVDGRLGRAFIIIGGGAAGQTTATTVYMLDLRTGDLTRTKTAATYPSDIAVDERTHHVFVAYDGANIVRMLDANTGVVLRTVRVGARPLRVVVVERTGRVFAVNEHSISVLDARSGIVLRTVATPIGANDTVAVDEQTRRIFATENAFIGPPQRPTAHPL